MTKTHGEAYEQLETIPGVGPNIAGHLKAIGVRRTSDLRKRDPEKLYEAFCAHEGYQVDRCLLYVLRCVVYYAGRSRHDPELLKWWNWKDKACAARK
jgi:hypothetical protein